jgi:hypothetical protein
MGSSTSKLFVKCKTCGTEFWSAINCDKQKFRYLQLGGNRHRCPNGHNDKYEKKDYYFKE